MGKHESKEYKDYVAKMIVEEGRKQTDLARELELSRSTIGRWVSEYKEEKQGDQDGDYLTPKEVKKLKREHEKEMQKLKEENEILKKAMHIFTKNQE